MLALLPVSTTTSAPGPGSAVLGIGAAWVSEKSALRMKMVQATFCEAEPTAFVAVIVNGK